MVKIVLRVKNYGLYNDIVFFIILNKYDVFINSQLITIVQNACAHYTLSKGNKCNRTQKGVNNYEFKKICCFIESYIFKILSALISNY